MVVALLERRKPLTILRNVKKAQKSELKMIEKRKVETKNKRVKVNGTKSKILRSHHMIY